jgi:hypothetical protein
VQNAQNKPVTKNAMILILVWGDMALSVHGLVPERQQGG